MNEYKSLLKEALGELHNAVRLMTAETFPRTPLPRPRRFVIIDGHVEWPYPGADWRAIRLVGRLADRVGLTEYLTLDLVLAACPTPRHVLHAIRQLRAAAAWCRARHEGRLRAAQNIVRQQANAVETLDAEIAIAALSRGEV